MILEVEVHQEFNEYSRFKRGSKRFKGSKGFKEVSKRFRRFKRFKQFETIQERSSAQLSWTQPMRFPRTVNLYEPLELLEPVEPLFESCSEAR
jgi:hypothetical protein